MESKEEIAKEMYESEVVRLDQLTEAEAQQELKKLSNLVSLMAEMVECIKKEKEKDASI